MTGKKVFLALLGFVLAIPFAAPEAARELESIFPPHAIIVASYRGDERMVREILATGPDKDVRDSLGSTALHGAMFQQNITVVRLLLDHGFDPNAVAAKTGYTPLHNAVAANNLGAARLLLQYGASKRIRCLEGHTPLDKARQAEKGAMVNILMH